MKTICTPVAKANQGNLGNLGTVLPFSGDKAEGKCRGSA